MHLDFIIEGITEEVEEWWKWWSTRTVPMTSKKPDGTELHSLIQLGLRERRAGTLIFPKECLDIVQNTLNAENCVVSMVDGKGTKRFGLILKTIRKLLRLKPLPISDKTKGIMPMRPFLNTRVIGLGIREDISVTEADGSKHEGI